MRVAIHSASGAAGSRLVESFQLAGSPTPVALAPDSAGLVRAGRLPVTLRRVEPGSAASLAAAFSGCFAAVFVPPENETPGGIVSGAEYFAEAARQARLRRIVMISDVAVHGPDPERSVDEDSPLPRHEPGSRPAALSAAEKILLEAGARNHPAPCVIRAGRLYGARVPEFAALAEELSAGSPGTTDGEAACNGLHVDNLVAAVRAALGTRADPRRIFIVTDTGQLTRDGFARAVASELGIQRGEIASDPAGTRRTARWHLGHARAGRLLGYQPAVDPAEAIRRSCAWWRFTRE